MTNAVLSTWFDDLDRCGRPHSTIGTYRQRVEKFERWCGSRRIAVERATGAEISEWLDELAAAPRTRYAYTSTLTTFFGWLVREGRIESNPALEVERPSFREPRATVVFVGDDWEIVEAWLRWLRRRNRATSTLREYRCTVARFTRWLQAEGLDLTVVDHRDVDAWLDHCDVGPTTRYRYTSTLSTFFGWAVREEYLRLDPTLRVDRPRTHRRLPRPAGDTSIRFALETAEPRVAAMIALGALAGLRRAEIAGLRREDLLLDRVPALILVHGKGDRDRLVPLHPEVLRRIEAHRLPERGWLFPSPELGRPLTPGSVGRLIAEALSTDIARVTAHPLRHWFATETYRASKDIRLVQELLGHANVQTTSVYTAWSPDDAAVVVAGLALP